jgi:hypothetical protein
MHLIQVQSAPQQVQEKGPVHHHLQAVTPAQLVVCHCACTTVHKDVSTMQQVCHVHTPEYELATTQQHPRREGAALQQVPSAYLASQPQKSMLAQHVWHVPAQGKKSETQALHQDTLLVPNVHQLRPSVSNPLN